MKVTIGNYILKKLNELNITDIFGVPGDYNLSFLDLIEKSKINWIGNCNELNGAYAADGYARVKNFSALVTTFGVGELSAINGIAGAYAEFVPIIKIVGMPALEMQRKKMTLHHTLGDGNFSVYHDIYKNVVVDSTIITSKKTAKAEIDRLIKNAFIKKRPVYIGLPSDMVHCEIEDNKKKLNLDYPKSDSKALNEAASKSASLVLEAKKPVFLLDICALRHPMKTMIEKLIEKTKIPFATMNMGKAILDETHPLFLGNYNGSSSKKSVQNRVEKSDLIIFFGSLYSDFNTLGFINQIEKKVSIEIHSNYVKILSSIYPNLYFKDFIPLFTKKIKKTNFQKTKIVKVKTNYIPSNKKITQDRFWNRMSGFIKKDSIILAETGTSMFGAIDLQLKKNVKFIAQPLYGSIGYTLGALLGSQLADRKKENILFIGDGSFQLTAQALSTIIRNELNPIIFLINNDGYTIERVIHGANMKYNDIHMWKYSELADIFNGNYYKEIVTNELELEIALQKANKNKNKLRFIEVVMDKKQCPKSLTALAKILKKINKY